MVGVVGVEKHVPQRRGALFIRLTLTVLKLSLTVLGNVVVYGALSHLQCQVQHHQVQCPVRRMADVAGVGFPVPQHSGVHATLRTPTVIQVPRIVPEIVAAFGAQM